MEQKFQIGETVYFIDVEDSEKELHGVSFYLPVFYAKCLKIMAIHVNNNEKILYRGDKERRNKRIGEFDEELLYKTKEDAESVVKSLYKSISEFYIAHRMSLPMSI